QPPQYLSSIKAFPTPISPFPSPLHEEKLPTHWSVLVQRLAWQPPCKSFPRNTLMI
uniref:Uncharacterized protein n=1 Tax=Macaca fascicularis TaxID=9541 RepID=A0A7N9DG83_MACFA